MSSYNKAFNDGLFHATDFLKSVAKELEDFQGEDSPDAGLLYELSDVILEDLKDSNEEAI
jgi:hypothetical protein